LALLSVRFTNLRLHEVHRGDLNSELGVGR
jgi:hypothetical protein